jgi:hypothetical protein
MQRKMTKGVNAKMIGEKEEGEEEEEREQEGLPHKQKIGDDPEIIYNKSMNAIGKLWAKLFNYKDLPGPKTDIDTVVVTPSQQYRLRLLKGLGPAERAALITQISQMHIAYVGFLKHARDVLAEENNSEVDLR